MGNNESLKAQFQSSASEVDAIFTNFRSLHEIYSSSITSLKKELGDLPNTYQQKMQNAHKTFENMARTVSVRQSVISGQLYSQGIVILVGNAESLLRDMFRELVVTNFRKLKITKEKGGLSFSLSEIIKADEDYQLGLLLLDKLEGDKNPAEKLNFQNMQSLQSILNYYFGIKISDSYIVDIHEFWQMRHVVIHNQSYVDKRFLDNLKAADINTKKYKQGVQVKITRADYENCFALLSLLFEKIDEELDRLDLRYDPLPF